MAMAGKRVVVISSLFLSLLLALVSVRADAGIDVNVAETGLRIEVDALKSKISALESSVEKKSKELKSKEEALALIERTVKEKADQVQSLQSELSSLQKKGKLDAAVEIGKADARAEELEKQLEMLNGNLKCGNQNEAFENRLSESEKKISVLAMKHDNVHSVWLPPWLAFHWSQCQSFVEMHWNEHGKPATNMLIQKATEKKVQAEEWAAPHIEKIKTEYLPAVRQQSSAIKASLEPHIQSVTAKAVEIYETSREAVPPHVVKAQEVVHPYYQEARKFIATLSKSRVDRLRLTTEPYTKKVVHAYGKFSKSASSYHHQATEKKVQAEEWAAPHIEKIKTEYLPAVRQQSSAIKAYLEPHIQYVTAKAVEIYDTSREAVTPHVVKAQEVVHPYYQEARKFSKPYIEQVATLSKPHVDKLRLTMEPYTKNVVHAYGKFLKFPSSNHHREYLPAVRQQSSAIKASLEDHIQSVTAKEQVATLSKPHVDKLRLTMEPYTKKVVHAYGKFLKCASSCHHQIQGNVEANLKRHELTRSLATKEFVWFVASSLLALPAIILFKFLSALFGTKLRRPARNSRKTYAHGKAKRGPDK